MGFFSWKTSDTKKSIANSSSSRPTFKVHMITEDGQVFTETDYEGYGVFGGKDFYTLLAELNGVKETDNDKARSEGIRIAFANGNGSGDCNGTFKAPKLVEELPRSDKNWKTFWDSLPHSTGCDSQGFFYEEEFVEDEDENY